MNLSVCGTSGVLILSLSLSVETETVFWDQGKFLEDKYISPLVPCVALAKTARQYLLRVAFKND